MSETIPDEQEISFTYEDKPVFATMVSGGVFISIFIYFILNLVFKQIEFPYRQQFILFVILFILIGSIQSGRRIDVSIQINTISGRIVAKSKKYYWEGNILDANKILVLEKTSLDQQGMEVTKYKLYLELDDATKYEIPLKVSEAKEAIEVIEKTNAHQKSLRN